MAAGFGFSVGDLIAGLTVIRTAIGAVNSSRGASADFEALIDEIDSLTLALESLEELCPDGYMSTKQQQAIDRVVLSCKKCIDDFRGRVTKKYEAHLQPGRTGWSSGLRKVKWVLCEKEDVANFQRRITTHTSSINTLLCTFQVTATIGEKKARAEREVAVAVTKPSHNDPNPHFHGLSADQFFFFKSILQQNEQLKLNNADLRRMVDMQTMIPPQVKLRDPVILLDALGQIAPFHLDFIDCEEALMAVLKLRFEKAGARPSSVLKVDRGEFRIQDTQRQRELEFGKMPFEALFKPGQHVDMSMVFQKNVPASTCPHCFTQNRSKEDVQSEW